MPEAQTNPKGMGEIMLELRTNRSLVKMFFLSIITFGIYPLVVYFHISEEINTVASKYDGQHTMNYLLVAFVFSWLTLDIVPIVWMHKLCNRMGRELQRRQIPYHFSAGSFWGWCVLGSLILVGPLVFWHQQMKAMNLINASYNAEIKGKFMEKKNCPFCGEEILDSAIKCKHCGSMLTA